MPLKLLDGVYIVASGRLGLSLTNEYDCTVVLVAGEGDSVLVDAGSGLAPELVLSEIAAADAPPVSRILLTHAHADHAAGAAGLARRLGAQVWASSLVADILEAADEERAGLVGAREAGVYPDTVTIEPTPVARRLGCERLDVGGLPIDVLETPGHAAGHLSYLIHHPAGRVLLSGDAVFARGRVVVLGTPDCDLRGLAASVELLAAVQPDVLVAGHGEPVLHGAARHVRSAADAFRRGAVPPGFMG